MSNNVIVIVQLYSFQVYNRGAIIDPASGPAIGIAFKIGNKLLIIPLASGPAIGILPIRPGPRCGYGPGPDGGGPCGPPSKPPNRGVGAVEIDNGKIIRAATFTFILLTKL